MLAVPAVLVGLLRATVDGLGPVLAELLEAVPEPLVLVDSRERIVSANRAFTRLVACEAVEAIGRPLADHLTRPAAEWEASAEELSYLRTPDGDVPVRVQIASHAPGGHGGLRLVLLADERARVAELGEREAQLALERTERRQLERVAAHLRQEAETDRLMPDAVGDPDELVERIHREASAPIRLPTSGGPVDVAAAMSVGFACGVPAQTGLDELLNWADTALYQAKRTGRDRVVRHEGDRRPGSVQPPTHTSHSARSDKVA